MPDTSATPSLGVPPSGSGSTLQASPCAAIPNAESLPQLPSPFADEGFAYYLPDQVRAIQRQAFDAGKAANGEVVVTKNAEGWIIAVTRQDEEGRWLKTIALSGADRPRRRRAADIAARRIESAAAASQATWEGLTAKEWAQRYHALQADALSIADIAHKVGDSYRAAHARGIECASTTTEGRGPKGEEPGAEGTRPGAVPPQPATPTVEQINQELLELLREVFSLDSALLADIYGSEFVERAQVVFARATSGASNV